jgi:hypothetical protein
MVDLVRIAGAQTEIQTYHLPNTRLQRYYYANILGKTPVIYGSFKLRSHFSRSKETTSKITALRTSESNIL